MTATVVQLFDAARELADADRAVLAGLLLESLDGAADAGVEAAWAKEIEQRARDFDEGRVKALPWEEVRARLLARESGSE